ncbi:Exocyst complex component Sec8 [[Candida] zeylanoides]
MRRTSTRSRESEPGTNGGRAGSRTGSSAATGAAGAGAAAAHQLKETLALLRYEWPQIAAGANPIELAIALLDDSSVGLAHKRPEFDDLRAQMGASLRRVVAEHYQTFTHSVGSYHHLAATVASCHADARAIEAQLADTTRDVHDRSDALAELNNASARYSEMLDILDAMEELRGVPALVERLVAQRKVHEVYDVISRAHKRAERHGVWALAAMATVRAQLEQQSNSLFDLIVEEVHAEVYLRGSGGSAGGSDAASAASAASAAAVGAPGAPELAALRTLLASTTLEQYIYNAANLDIGDTAACLVAPAERFLRRQLPRIHAHHAPVAAAAAPATPAYAILLDVGQSPVAESLHYLYMLLFTAYKLNRLPQVLDILGTTAQHEFHAMVNATTAEIKREHPRVAAGAPGLYAAVSDASVAVLQSLFSQVFCRSLAVLQRHKVVSEIVRRLADPDAADRYFAASSAVMQKEIQALLVNYISDAPAAAPAAATPGDVSSVLERATFRFADAAPDAAPDASPYIKNESFNAMVEVLVPRHIFNMRIALESFLVFVGGAQRVAGAAAVEFFAAFMTRTFLPKLRETVGHVFGDIVGARFRADLSDVDGRTLYSSAPEFKRLGVYLCFVLNTSLAYRRGLSDLCLDFFKRFATEYDRYYQGLVGGAAHPAQSVDDVTATPAPASASQIHTWMKIPALVEVSKTIVAAGGAGGDAANAADAAADETRLMLSNSAASGKDDFLDSDTFQHVCHLLVTTTWILSWLPQMRKSSVYSLYDDALDEVDKLKADWAFLESGRVGAPATSVFLALPPSLVGQFDDVVATFARIRTHTLLALRYDLRCKAIYYISRSFEEGDWTPPAEPADCDHFIGEYNRQVFQVDNKLSRVLDPAEKECVFGGLAPFLEALLISKSQLCRQMSTNGVKRVMLNILVLQQMLRNIVSSPESVNFNRSLAYFEMFTMTEFALVEAIQRNEHALSEHDYENLARLIYSEKLQGGGTSFNRSKHSDLVKKIHHAFA